MATENLDNTLAPFEEFIGAEEFTNRKPELEFLWSLADQATRRTAPSYAIIARKGMGKTALMLEFYRQLFTQRQKVVPFYVSFAEYKDKPGRVQLSLKQFISILFTNFAFQYGAFKSEKFSSPPALPRTVTKQKKFFASLEDRLLEEEYLDHLHALETNDIHNAFHHAIDFAMMMTSRRGEAGIVMIDEFQVLTEVYDEGLAQFVDITAAFQKAAEARWCPMVVSGSAVSLVVDTVMGGLLARRFGPYYLDPFDQQHSLEYAYKLSRKQQVKLSEEAAVEIYRLTGGNPYYIWCFFNSLGLKENDLSTLEKIAELYTFETIDRQGKIRQFWDTHFKAVSDKINEDKIGLQALHQLAVAKQEARAEEVAAVLGVQPEKVLRALKNLEEADLIERQTGSIFPVYDRIKDPILAAYVEREYQTGLVGQRLDSFIQAQFQAIRQRAGRAARSVGEAAELNTRLLLLSFAGQEVDATAVFNLEAGNLRLPKFNKVEHRTGLVIEGEMIEFDLLAEGEETWLVEVKYRKTPVRVADVEKFLEKLSKMEGWQLPLPEGKRLWFFSRSGFDEQAAARLRELNIMHSDVLGFNAICRAVNVGELPVT
jgi:DNA-binding Lrp family transcriptional regulator